jgi:ABC-type transport system substrate-binding protein
LYVDQVATVWWIAINLAVPPFDDIHVRKAVTLAIDRDELRRRWARLTTPGPGPIPGIVADHLAPDALEGELLPDNYRPSWMPPGDGSHVRAARAEMRRSPYDTNGDGRCDARVCRHTEIVSDVAWPRPFDAVVRQGMKGIGIHVSVKRQSFASYYCRCSKSAASPGARTAMFANGWANDYPNGAGFFPTLFYGPNLSRFRSGAIDLSMLGATTEQLRAWGYPVHHVPSVDGQIDLCDAATGESQVACWAALDKHLMEKVVPWVPFLFQTVVKIVSPRVAHYSFDQATGLPALDQIALKAGST